MVYVVSKATEEKDSVIGTKTGAVSSDFKYYYKVVVCFSFESPRKLMEFLFKFILEYKKFKNRFNIDFWLLPHLKLQRDILNFLFKANILFWQRQNISLALYLIQEAFWNSDYENNSIFTVLFVAPWKGMHVAKLLTCRNHENLKYDPPLKSIKIESRGEREQKMTWINRNYC